LAVVVVVEPMMRLHTRSQTTAKMVLIQFFLLSILLVEALVEVSFLRVKVAPVLLAVLAAVLRRKAQQEALETRLAHLLPVVTALLL